MSMVTSLKLRLPRLATLLIEAIAGVSSALAVGTLAVALWPHSQTPIGPPSEPESRVAPVQVATPYVPESEILVLPTQKPDTPWRLPDPAQPKIK